MVYELGGEEGEGLTAVVEKLGYGRLRLLPIRSWHVRRSSIGLDSRCGLRLRLLRLGRGEKCLVVVYILDSRSEGHGTWDGRWEGGHGMAILGCSACQYVVLRKWMVGW